MKLMLLAFSAVLSIALSSSAASLPLMYAADPVLSVRLRAAESFVGVNLVNTGVPIQPIGSLTMTPHLITTDIESFTVTADDSPFSFGGVVGAGTPWSLTIDTVSATMTGNVLPVLTIPYGSSSGSSNLASHRVVFSVYGHLSFNGTIIPFNFDQVHIGGDLPDSWGVGINFAATPTSVAIAQFHIPGAVPGPTPYTLESSIGSIDGVDFTLFTALGASQLTYSAPEPGAMLLLAGAVAAALARKLCSGFSSARS